MTNRCFVLFALLPSILFCSPLWAENAGSEASSSLLPDHYEENCVVFRIKPAYRNVCAENNIRDNSLNQIFHVIGAWKTAKIFPEKHAVSGTAKTSPEKKVDLSLIYEVRWTAPLSVDKVVTRLMATGKVVYAEARRLPQLLYTPNDPAIPGQYELPLLQSFPAWDLSVGDTSIVIGISDTGTDIDHEDLQGNIKYNYNDPVNGLDDDGDGYLDNFRGWDLGQNDNDPSSNDIGKHHGVFVSGLAAASTDNGLGMAGSGFRCKFLPLKITDSGGRLVKGYESIVYAADHGCAVINCSWGAKGFKSQYEQDIINYATFNEDALVVAAAGNDNDAIPFYPASYDHVLSVAATGTGDIKWGGSSYGSTVDICAPGDQVYSTWNGNGYIKSSGTSFASPITAGCAGIIRSYLPHLSALQVAALIKGSADVIDTIAANQPYAGLLGTGRLNLLRTLTGNGGPAIEMESIHVEDNNDQQWHSGDTLSIYLTLKNYLGASNQLGLKLTSASSYVTIPVDTATMPGLGNLQTGSHAGDPFSVIVLPGAPAGTPLYFLVAVSDGSYRTTIAFSLMVNLDYINLAENRISTTVTGMGNLGFKEPQTGEGTGFSYDQSGNLLYEGGLMIGSRNKVSDSRMNSLGNGYDADFYNLKTIAVLANPAMADHETFTTFNDISASADRLYIEVDQRSMVWKQAPDNGFVIMEYTIRNTGGSTLDSLYTGIYADWDIQDPMRNRAGTDINKRLGYVYNIQPGGHFAGVKVLSSEKFVHYAIDNTSSGSGGVVLTDGFTATEKYTTLSSDRTDAGSKLGGEDVISVVSSGPYAIEPGDSIKVAFALLAGNSLENLTATGQLAQQKYDPSLTGLHNPTVFTRDQILIYPVPAKDRVWIATDRPVDPDSPPGLWDGMGRRINVIAGISPDGKRISFELNHLNPGCYFIRLYHTEGSYTSHRILIGH